MSHRTAKAGADKPDRLLTIQHATPRRNVPSILRAGLLPGLARGKLKAVWLHAARKTRWSIQHVSRRHHVPEDKVVVLVVRVPRSMLRRKRRCIWYCPFIITPRQIVSVNGLKLFSPVAV